MARPFAFVQITDLHVGLCGITDPVKALSEDLRQIETEVGDRISFVVATGDLTDRGTESQCRMYLEAAQATRLKIHPVVGNHDYASGGNGIPERWDAAWYQELVAPLNYSFDFQGIHFVSYDYTNQEPVFRPAPLDFDRLGKNPSRWLIQDLSSQPVDTSIVLLIHDQKESDFYEQLRRFRIAGTISGHWHSSRLYYDGRVAHYNGPSLSFGGIDYSPRAYRVFTWDGTQLRCETVALKKVRPKRAGSISPAKFTWRAPLGGEVHLGSPVAADGKLFLGLMDEDRVNNGAVACWDIETGKQIWRVHAGASIKNSLAYHDGKIIAVTVTGEVVAFDANDGGRLWSYQLGDPSCRWIFSAPQVCNGRVFVGQGPHFAALEADTGKLIWVRDDLTKSDWISSYVTPVTDGELVFIAFFWQPNSLFALSAKTGQTMWQPAPGPGQTFATAPCALDDQGGLFAFVQDGLCRFDARSGALRWSIALSNSWNPSAPVAVDGRVYAATGMGELLGIDSATGKIEWRWECADDLAAMHPYRRQGKTIISSPRLSHDCVIVGTNDGRLVAIDKKNGRQRHSWTFEEPVTSSPLVTDDKIYIAVRDGYLYALSGSPLRL